MQVPPLVMKKFELRFNTRWPEFGKKWRLLVDGVEHQVDHVIFRCHSWTESRDVPGHGIKHHVAASAWEWEVRDGTAYVGRN